MSTTIKTIRTMFVLAGISVIAGSASALPYDARIMIDRALNSPVLTIRYDGVSATLVELRINGESLGTRSVEGSKAAGETNFTINLTDLKDGDNDVEVRLYDRTGKLVGSEKSGISTDQTNYGPVFLRTPKVGTTVMGNVEINMGFGRELKDVYVSFFIDNNFKKITNYPPYTMNWDTTGESNGWHEVEAWAVDDSSTTYKTRRTRVFVNNPGGRTNRIGAEVEVTPTRNPVRPQTVDGGSTTLRNVQISGSPKVVEGEKIHLEPKVFTGTTVSNKVRTTVDLESGTKSAPLKAPAVMGVRPIAPSSMKVVTNYSPLPKTSGEISIVVHNPKAAPIASGFNNQLSGVPTVSSVPRVASANSTVALSHLVRISKGQRIPNLTSFEVVLNSAIVNFPDVQPRVDGGVPMTPFRYLMEQAGSKVKWANETKTVTAASDGRDIVLQIGDKNAKINSLRVGLEIAPYIDRGRTIVPVSFLHDALNVNVDYDKETGHVLISSAGK